jgi:hypothetical protein
MSLLQGPLFIQNSNQIFRKFLEFIIDVNYYGIYNLYEKIIVFDGV